MKGYCGVCGAVVKVKKVTNPGDAGYHKDNKLANYRLTKHTRDDIGGECPNEGLPPISLE